VIHISPEFNEEIPKWDVALEALLRETCEHKGKPLDVRDIHRLSQQYMIRFDDLMITLLELVALEFWQYRDEGGVARTLSRDDVDRIRGEGRFDVQDIDRLTGWWQPRPE